MPPLVVDVGTGFIKAGFAGEERPTAIMPNCVGRSRLTAIPGMQSTISAPPHTTAAAKEDGVFVGQEALNKRGAGLTLRYPVEHGVVTDWADAERVWHHLFFYELRADPADHPVLLTEAPLNPRRNRERLASVMFEAFHVPAFFVAVQAVLSLYAAGRTTGVVLDMGDGVSHVVPVYEGYSLPHAVQRLNLAGRDLTEYTAKLMGECGSGTPLRTSAEKEIAREIKERYAYVARDFEQEVQRFERDPKAFQRQHAMPDGQVVTVDEVAFRVPECLFQPALLGLEAPGVDALVHEAVQKCDMDLRRSLYGNVVVSGGTSMLSGMPERLRMELQKRVPANVKVKVVAPPDRKYAVFQGGSVLAGLETFQQMWITREEYEEFGANIVHRRCI
ncbi:hypothetical protein CDCA_CDCA06G1813 [Cyanidium caldarium]|uniref:Actin n=1 Tax=Cyanidium caldarium TaxID=2771 RepID=A0AAV9IVD5_CYACA|nr:hypothetical protein CDCA_CDCA06G1813 [Cyanidium caldarium]